MDPTLNSLAYKLHADMLAQESQHPEPESELGRPMLHRLGSLLVTVGQKLQARAQMTFEGGGYDNEVCAYR